MILGLATFMQLAASCAPSVAAETLAAIARTESGFEVYVMHDNDTGQTFKPESLVQAATLSSSLIGAGHNIDVGLMQVNSANFQRLGLTVVKALDPCASLAAGAQVLVDGYQGGASDDQRQTALRDAISRYNTGSSNGGYLNGYVARVEASATQIVPAIRVTSLSTPNPTVSPKQPVVAAPAAVMDMLHATEVPAGEPSGAVNMLGGVAGATPDIATSVQAANH